MNLSTFDSTFQGLKPWIAGLSFLSLILLLSGCAENTAHQEANSAVDNQIGKDPELGPYISEGLDRVQLSDRDVLRAISRVPRHEFVPSELRDEAYQDRPLPIGKGQTISQPFIVALMTQEARVSRGARVLEIGTGSGYQAAVLAELGATVFSIEIVPELASSASERLSRLGYAQVTVRQGDGWDGWSEEAPFDSILVTASSPKVPEKLLGQLANKGRMIIPIERTAEDGEDLLVVERQDASFVTRNLGAVRFVPLTGEGRE